MFRIIFDTNLAQWVIQLSSFAGLRWATVQDRHAEKRKPLTFETLEDANQYVTKVGLDQAYQRKSAVPPMLAAMEVDPRQYRHPSYIITNQHSVV